MTTRGARYADEFEAIVDEVAAMVTECGSDEWRLPSTGEGWKVAAVAHHIAEVQGAFNSLIERLESGETYSPTISMAEIDANNARHARDFATVDRAEVLALLRANGAAGAEILRRLGDEQFERTAGVFGGHELSVEQVAEWVMIGHAREHLESIRTTIGRPAAAAD